MLHNRQARREAFSEVPETCPTVDRAADELDTAVKDALKAMVKTIKSECTERLRDAYIQALEDKIKAEARVEELESEKEDLETRVKELEKQVERLEREVEDAAE